MPGAIQRVGDPNSAGGLIVSGDPTVLVNGRPIAIQNVAVTPHPCCGQRGCPPIHCDARTQSNAANILVNGRPVILAGDIDTCGHPRVAGSPDVRAG